jgi:DNA-directed RNA polymerase subunit RPC12/RpoP
MSDETISVIYGCSACGKTTRIDGCAIGDLIRPRGLEMTCPSCRKPVGQVTFDSREELAAALELPPMAEAVAARILFFNAVPYLRHHHREP